MSGCSVHRMWYIYIYIYIYICPPQSGQKITWPKFESCTSMMQVYSTANVYTSLLRFYIKKAWSRSLLRKISEMKYKKTFQHTCFTRCVLGWQLMDRLIINSEYRGTIHCVRAAYIHTWYICTFLRYQACTFAWILREREEISVENGPL